MIKIVLKGYYGFGNLGDDILMLVSCKILKEIFPKSHLIIATAGTNTNYIIPFTEGLVKEVITLSPEPEADLVVHGGGGTYYDYKSGNIFYFFLNRIIDQVGIIAVSKCLNVYRQLKGWPPNTNTKRVALGVGIGSFTRSSKKYYHKMSELSKFDMIFPRDKKSFQLLSEKQLKGKIIQGADLAFYKEHWLPNVLISETIPAKSIGLVLKSWNDEFNYLSTLHQLAKDLEEEGHTVTIYTFEKPHDKEVPVYFSDFRVVQWSPNSMTLYQYIEALQGNSLLVTSRAHGVVLGAALGIPSICIGIEPKLLSFSKMFPSSTSYATIPISSEKLHQMVIQGLSVKKEKVNLDFENNRDQMFNFMLKFKNLLRSDEYGLD